MTVPTDRSVKRLRHSIRKRAFWIFQLTSGMPGATQEQQVQILDKQIELLKEALAKAEEARQLVATRDWDAYKAAKDAKAQTPAVEKVPDSDEKQMADLTFEQLVSDLEKKAPGGDQPKDDIPPF
jgi:hypothetical protein